MASTHTRHTLDTCTHAYIHFDVSLRRRRKREREKGIEIGKERGREGERERARGKGKTSEKSKTTESSRLPVDSCLSSPLLPPLLRSSTKLRGLVRSFPPTGAQLPYHVTAAATNQSGSQPATMMDSAARMQHVSGATGITAAGAPTSLSSCDGPTPTTILDSAHFPSFLPSFPLYIYRVLPIERTLPNPRSHSPLSPSGSSGIHPKTHGPRKNTHTHSGGDGRGRIVGRYIYINPKLREREVQTARRSSFVGAISLNALTRLLLYVSNAIRNEDNILIRTGRDDGNARRRRNIGEHRRFNGAPVRKSHGKRARPASAETRLATPPTLFPGSLPGRTRPAGFEPFA